MFERLKKKGTKKIITETSKHVKKEVKKNLKPVLTMITIVACIGIMFISAIKKPGILSPQPVINNYVVYNGPVYSHE